MNTQLHMEQAERATRTVGDATRRRLLDAGRAHFARLGYRGTSVQAVLTEAGVSPPVLYHHYGDKAGLFVAVGEEVYAEFLARLRLALPERVGFEQALDAVLLEAARITRTEPALPQMAFTVQMEIQRDNRLAARLRPSVRAFRAFIDELVDLASDRLRQAVASEDLSRALIAILNGLTSVAVSISNPDDFPAIVHAVRVLLGTANDRDHSREDK